MHGLASGRHLFLVRGMVHEAMDGDGSVVGGAGAGAGGGSVAA